MLAHATAPCRIGIAGGGTDLPAWTGSGRVGRCLSLAIDLHTHAVAIPRSDGQVVASYRRRDEAACATEIGNGLVRESAILHGFETGFEIHTLSEVSSRGTGLGVSSSIAVALAACFSQMSPAVAASSPASIAHRAWTVEIDRLRRSIGRQDHMAAAHGGLRLYRFEGDAASVERTFTSDDAAWVAAHLLLVELPDGHDSRKILSGVKSPLALQAAADAVPVAVDAIQDRDARGLGRALEMGQLSKAMIPGAIPRAVSEVAEALRALPGIRGVKVAGAGGGGHLVVACEGGSADPIRTATGLHAFEVRPDLLGVRSGRST